METIGVLILDFYCFIIALHKRAIKNVFQLHLLQYKIDTAPVIKSFVFQLGQISHFEKIKVTYIEHLKQKLSLENN